MLGLNPSFLWHLIFQLCCIVKLRKVAISKLVWPNNKVNRTSEVCCFVFRLHWAGVLTLEQEVKLNLLMSKTGEPAWLRAPDMWVFVRRGIWISCQSMHRKGSSAWVVISTQYAQESCGRNPVFMKGFIIYGSDCACHGLKQFFMRSLKVTGISNRCLQLCWLLRLEQWTKFAQGAQSLLNKWHFGIGS